MQTMAAECIQRFWRRCINRGEGATTQRLVGRSRAERAEKVRRELGKLADIEAQREAQRLDWNKKQLLNAKQKVSELIQARRGRDNAEDNAGRRKAIFAQLMRDENQNSGLRSHPQ